MLPARPLSLAFTLAASALLLFTLAALPGCGDASQAQNDDALGQPPYNIVTTTGMVGDIVEQVVGEHGEVVNLMGEGTDPHIYDPTRNDMIRLQNADIIFYSGLLLEGRMTDPLIRIAQRGKPVFAVTNMIERDAIIEAEDYAGEMDPHVWMDVSAWSKAVQAVAEQMAELNPENAQFYRDNAASYQQRLSELDDYVHRVIASIPEPRRVLVTAHDAFNYFGRAYDIEVRGIQGISTQSEAGTADINHLVDFLVENNIPAVFVETSVSDKAVRALIEGAQSRGHEVEIGGLLFSDAMGNPDTYEGTYIGMLDHNATTIARALGGDAPEKGWQGELTGYSH